MGLDLRSLIITLACFSVYNYPACEMASCLAMTRFCCLGARTRYWRFIAQNDKVRVGGFIGVCYKYLVPMALLRVKACSAVGAVIFLWVVFVRFG